MPAEAFMAATYSSERPFTAMLRPSPLREDILAHLTDRATESRFPLTPQRIIHDVRQAVPDVGIVCLDNGMFKIWFARNYRTHVANTLLLDNALATMGAGLPAAIAAALIYPARRVLAVLTDWGLTFGNPDFVAYAASYGARGLRVAAADGLAPALEAAFNAGGVHLVVVPVDYSENMRVLSDELRKLTAGPGLEARD
jgi:acetolactate synthase I/II/III large subunit